MGFFDSKKNVEDYIKMVEGSDGSELIDTLKTYVASGRSVLEIGMGPGKDLDILSKSFTAIGSDNSQVFLDLYHEKNPGADLMLLDAVRMDTERTFDCIYSNKVLHHLTQKELEQSLKKQRQVVKDNGILFHSFWHGDKIEFHHGLRFTFYTEETIFPMIPKGLKILEFTVYKEFEKNDSFYLVLQKLPR